jgi:hypothetical protein
LKTCGITCRSNSPSWVFCSTLAWTGQTPAVLVFFEIDGAANVYYVLRYPFRHEVMLVAVWDRHGDPKAEFVACAEVLGGRTGKF